MGHNVISSESKSWNWIYLILYNSNIYLKTIFKEHLTQNIYIFCLNQQRLSCSVKRPCHLPFLSNFSCKTFIPCCCAYVICENCKCSTKSACKDCKCGPGGPSFFSNLATLPTGLVTFVYIYRVLRYFCELEMTYFLFDFLIDTVIGTVWDVAF